MICMLIEVHIKPSALEEFLEVIKYDAVHSEGDEPGWATFGVVWSKPIMMVAVRSSRHTFGIIEAAKDFTVTVPAGDMHKETAYCGSKSGRDVDKFKMCNLETTDSRQTASPIIKARGRHYECKIIYKSAMDPSHLDKDYDSSLYPEKDYHTLYFGEILACYETD